MSLREFVCTVGMQEPQKPEGSIVALKTGVTGSCKPACGCWEPSSCPLQESQAPAPQLLHSLAKDTGVKLA